MKVKDLLEYGRNNLIGKEEPYRISKVFLKEVLKVEDSYLIVHENEEMSEAIEKFFKDGITLLNRGKPLQYITHHQEFMKLDFYVDEHVLIPQPDTEILVEEIISICKNKQEKTSILDLCTGSGAVGVAIANYIEHSEVTLADISKEALAVAKKNVEENEVAKRCELIESDLFGKIDKKFDIIVSNPPYIPTEIIETLANEVQAEPRIALDGGEEGLEFYQRIAKEAWRYLKKDGILALEIGYDQKEKVEKLLKKEDKYNNIITKQDLAGNDRVVICKLK